MQGTSSFGIRFSFAVSCEKVYHCVFSHSSSTSNECYVSCCSQNSLWMARLRSISWCRHNDADFLFHLDLQCPFITAHTTDRLSHCCIYAMYVVEWYKGCTYWLACKNSRPILQLNFFIQICFAWECRIVINEQIFDAQWYVWQKMYPLKFRIIGGEDFCPTNQKCDLVCSNLLSMHLTW